MNNYKISKNLTLKKLEKYKRKGYTICYIAGKISGLPHDKAEKNFKRAMKSLCARDSKLIAVSPMHINHNHDLSWEGYMKEDAKYLTFCTHIYFLSNWRKSRGAKFERECAKNWGITFLEV